jgi:hypothetical protein
MVTAIRGGCDKTSAYRKAAKSLPRFVAGGIGGKERIEARRIAAYTE